MQAEGVDGEQVGDGEVLLLVAHVGASHRRLPQTQVGATLSKNACRATHRKLSTKPGKLQVVSERIRIINTGAGVEGDVHCMEAEFLCVLLRLRTIYLDKMSDAECVNVSNE